MSSIDMSLPFPFNRNNILGRGIGTFVSICQHQGVSVAVKRVELNLSGERRPVDIATVLQLNHKNVMKIFGIYEDEDFRYVSMELCAGTLGDVIDKESQGNYIGPELPVDKKVLYQMADGIDYIHSRGLIHRNINPNNILISVDSIIKVSDFGLCEESDSRSSFSGPSGTLIWTAPEFITNREQRTRGTRKSDIFSTGLVFSVFLTRDNGGVHPFGKKSNDLEVLNNIVKGDPVNLKEIESKDEYEIIRGMLHHKPNERHSSDDVKRLLQPTKITLHNKKIPTQLQTTFDRNKVLRTGNGTIIFEGKYGNTPAAVKRIMLDLENRQNEAVQKKSEFEIQSALNHVNVLKTYAVYEDENFWYIALELCAGTLEDVIKNECNGRVLPADREVLYQIADGLDYIHSQDHAHRDIKPANILVSFGAVIKISDFGSSKKISSRDTFTMSGIRGTLPWMAPECQEITENRRGTKKSDIFSAGLVFFVFLTRDRGGIHPFGKISDIAILTNIRENNPINIKELKLKYELELIQGMIHNDPQNRLSLPNVKQKLCSLRDVV